MAEPVSRSLQVAAKGATMFAEPPRLVSESSRIHSMTEVSLLLNSDLAQASPLLQAPQWPGRASAASNEPAEARHRS